MTRDEVIKALEHEIVRADYADLDWINCVKVAPLRDALALLKEEPRSLSLDDVLKIYYTLDSHVWPYNTPPYLWCEVNRRASYWVKWRDVVDIIERIVTLRPFSIDNYGELWTLYTKRSDKEDTKCEAKRDGEHD